MRGKTTPKAKPSRKGRDGSKMPGRARGKLARGGPDTSSRHAMQARNRAAGTRLIGKQADGWANVLTGLGLQGRDKKESTTFCGRDISFELAETLWTFSDLAAKIVEKVPEEMLRAGYEVCVDDEPEQGKDIGAALETLKANEAFQLALCQERAMRGSAIYVGAVDGASPEKPLRENAIRKISHLTVFNARELQAETFYGDPKKEKYGEVETYRLNQETFGRGAAFDALIIHESRLIVFPGIKTTRRMSARTLANGWGFSVLARCIDVIRDYAYAWANAGALLADFAQAVIKIKGLAEILAAHGDDALRERLLAMDMQRSSTRSIMLDADEEFERKGTPLEGLPDLLDKFAARLAAAADIPVTILMGDSPSGMNATGDGDHRAWNNRIASMQVKHLQPRLEKLIRILMLSKEGPTGGVEPEGWKVTFCPLQKLTALEEAQIRKTNADADSVYVKDGVLMPEEITVSRFGGDRYGTEITVDMEHRERQAKAEARVVGEEAAAEDPHGVKQIEAKAEIAKATGEDPDAPKGEKP